MVKIMSQTVSEVDRSSLRNIHINKTFQCFVYFLASQRFKDLDLLTEMVVNNRTVIIVPSFKS